MVTGEAELETRKRVRFSGWRSEHIDAPASIYLWYTSQAMLFLAYYAAMLRDFLAKRALASVGLVAKPFDRPEGVAARWADLATNVEPPVLLSDSGNPYRLSNVVERYYIRPRATSSEVMHRARYSLLLYGPPGTGKTSLARVIAQSLGCRYIEITPSDFIRLGEAEVEARAKRIFETLQEQSQTVILFDEIDRMILDRDSRMYQNQGDVFQFMTPGMLTKLKELRSRRDPLFIVATNYVERIDRAIKRRGRIDDRLLVLPPDTWGRFTILLKLLRDPEKSPHANLFDSLSADDCLEVLRPVVDVTDLFVYGDLEQLVDEASEVTTTTAQRVGQELRALAETVTPVITLGAYRSRFRLHPQHQLDFPTVEEPLEEFLALVCLVLEARGDIPDAHDKELLQQILVGPKAVPVSRGDVQERLKVVRDSRMQQVLFNAVERWGWFSTS